MDGFLFYKITLLKCLALLHVGQCHWSAAQRVDYIAANVQAQYDPAMRARVENGSNKHSRSKGAFGFKMPFAE
jgi:hypothetical protein